MLSEEMRKIFLAGLGAVAVTAEKSKAIVDELVKKGEVTVEQGKVLNEELKHHVSEKVKEHVTVNITTPGDVESVKEAVTKMTPEERAAVKAKIAEMDADQAENGKAPSAPEASENAGK